MELTRTLRITNDLGLHARAAAKIVELAGQYDARLYLAKDGSEVEGGSILSILTLACPKGTEVIVRIDGKDAEALMEALCRLFQEKFGEAS
jgi:phosphocarrier protein